MVHGLPKLKVHQLNCETCTKAKQSRTPFPKKNEKSTTELLQLIHTDLCGPMRIQSARQKKYFVTFIDDYSRKVWVYFLQKRSEYLNIFKNFKKIVETATGKSIKTIRSDNALELTSREFSKYLSDSGIQRQLTVEYSPQQNGVAERMNRTLVEMVRCFMVEGNLPEILWAELINTAAYIRNRCPTHINNNKTPEELWSRKVPTVRHLRRIGCIAFALNNKPGKSKFEPRSYEYILVGYDEVSKAYILWRKGTTQVIKSRDVKFFENEILDKNNQNKEENEVRFYEYNTDVRNSSKKFLSKENIERNLIEEPQNVEEIDEFFDSFDQVEEQSQEEAEPIVPIKQRLRSWNKNKDVVKVVASEEDPKTYKDVLNLKDSEQWLKAMREE